MTRHLHLALIALPLLLIEPRASIADEPDCAPIRVILEEAQHGFRALKTQEYSTQFESWQSRQTLPGYESCWIDDVSHRFWCLNRAPSVEAAAQAAAAQVETIARCWPDAPSRQATEIGDNNVTRLIRDWALPVDRRLRLVHRMPTRGDGLGSVFLYVY
jgi:hypothetical protein